MNFVEMVFQYIAAEIGAHRALEHITALLTLGTVVAAWLTARATRQAAEAELLLKMLNEYGQPEMNEALRTLRGWRQIHGDDFAPEWKKRLSKNDSDAVAVDRARRLVGSYFYNADQLRQGRLISARVHRSMADKSGLGVLFEVIEPLERQLGLLPDLEFAHRLRRRFPDRARAGLSTSIPIAPRGEKP